MSVFCSDILGQRVALVTGGATEIGKEIARTLGQHGARVCIASRKQENLEAACKDLESEGLDCMFPVCDIREPEQVEAVIDKILDQHEQLDIVISNAAGNFPAPITKISYSGFKSTIDLDLRGAYNVTKAAFEKALKRGGGQIVNISAPFQHHGVTYQAHVAAAKTGADSLTRTCAVKFGPYGIRVNGIAPGATGETEGMARFTEANPDIPDGASNPLGFLGSKRDIANALLFLVSNAARYVTGQIFSVDGGSTIDMLKIRLPTESVRMKTCSAYS